MARHESDRENLIDEATALKRRIEVSVPGESESIVAGFRSDDYLSLYFGPDPVYHFDNQGCLRRAYVEGHLFRTEGNTLAQLDRVRTDTETQLQRRDLTQQQLEQFLVNMQQRLETFRDAILRDEVKIIRQVPDGDPILPDLAKEITSILESSLPFAPPIKGRS